VERLRDAIAAALPEASPEIDTETCLALVEQRRPTWPGAELGELLRAMDKARFAHLPDVDAVGMYRSASDLGRRITGAPA
jgi:hypothetical protein